MPIARDANDSECKGAFMGATEIIILFAALMVGFFIGLKIGKA